ncbi:MAG: hypothetical protein VYA28_06980, partial [Pseudomonadota bacterium]|nr:hypothetical protein [Pseudomonadota bacterium]
MRIIESFKGPKAMDTSRIIKQKARIPSLGRSLAKRFWFLGVTVFCLLNANFSYSQIPQSERDVLISIYNATNGGSWTNNTGWNGAAGTECSWFGIICSGGSDDLSRNVTNLNVNSNQVSGTVPDVFAGLPYLTEFNVLNNSLTGSLPSSFGSAMSNLELGSNQFTGTVPASYGDLPNLVFLGLWNNQLTGPAPDSVLNKSGLDLRTENAFANIANMAPSASITQVCSGDPSVCTTVTGGASSVADSDDAVGETVSLVAVASDTDGTVTGQFLVGGSVVASNTQSASISLPDGSTVVTFKATDDDGASATTTVSITVEAPPPNEAPSVTITGGDRTVADTDDAVGETVTVAGVVSDSDGTVPTTQWLVGGSVVSTNTGSASISLPDGTTVVTLKAIDDDGASSTTSVEITVTAPAPNVAPSVTITGGDRTIADTNGNAGETVS